MLSYCLKFEENTKSTSLLVSKTINGGPIILSKCAVFNTKKLEVKGILRNLVIRSLLSKIPILRDVLF